MDGAASHDGRSVVTATLAQRTHKQRASGPARRVSHVPAFAAAGQGITAMRGSSSAPGAYGEVGKVRRGSIRHAVRKIFGRSSRDGPPRSPHVSAPVSAPLSRHAYHKSEPAAMMPAEPIPVLPYPSQDADVFSSHNRTKISSPYAVQFPKSAMLKPRDLGNPFGPDAGMKRRKTMPTTGLPIRDAANAAANVPVPSAHNQTMPDRDHDIQTRRALSQIKKARRKSRSTDDLVGMGIETSLPAKRSDEIRYWRESFKPDVLRTSGFNSRAVQADSAADLSPTSRQNLLEDGEQTPVPPAAEIYQTAKLSISPASSSSHHKGIYVTGEQSRPSSPLELSKDLEQRVLRLEAGLNSFQRSLERLTADRNRRTIVLRSPMTMQRSSTDMRTPSMLADTLVDSLEPSTYEYEYGRTLRPSASANPASGSQSRNQYDDPFGPFTPRSEHYADSASLPTPPYSRSVHSPEEVFQSHSASLPPSSANSSRQHQYTFQSVYQMLSDERSARNKLETQLKHLQHEIHGLHAQVNVTSRRPNDRNSYALAGSSARLQQLLQETEENPTRRSSGLSASKPLPVTSRFSGSESETGCQDQDEPETPNGAYLTPREERSAQSLAERMTAKDEDLDCMF